MKRIILLSLCAAIVILALSGCVSINFAYGSGVVGKGDPEKYEFEVGEIHEIQMDIFCDIQYYAAPSDTVTLEIQPNLLEHVTVEESGGVLTVHSSKNISWSGNAPVLTVSTPELNRLSLSGAGTFTAHDVITANSFSLYIDGAVDGSAELDVGNLTVTVDGAGNLNLSGEADTAGFTLSGAGNLDAFLLQVRDATVNLSGVGMVRVSCSDTLRINADGMGTVEYKGSPVLDLDKDGLVKVSKVG